MRNAEKELNKWNKEIFGLCQNHIVELKAVQSMIQTKDNLLLERHIQVELHEWQKTL